MKTLLILILALALAGGAFLSKPNQDNFTAFTKSQTDSGQATNTLTGLIGGLLSKATQPQIVYSDHVLWATEDQNGQHLYYGAFSHWWKAGSVPTPAPTNK